MRLGIGRKPFVAHLHGFGKSCEMGEMDEMKAVDLQPNASSLVPFLFFSSLSFSGKRAAEFDCTCRKESCKSCSVPAVSWRQLLELEGPDLMGKYQLLEQLVAGARKGQPRPTECLVVMSCNPSERSKWTRSRLPSKYVPYEGQMRLSWRATQTRFRLGVRVVAHWLVCCFFQNFISF